MQKRHDTAFKLEHSNPETLIVSAKVVQEYTEIQAQENCMHLWSSLFHLLLGVQGGVEWGQQQGTLCWPAGSAGMCSLVHNSWRHSAS